MRARISAAFALGFATGVFCLGVALWHAGNLKSAAALFPHETTATAAAPEPATAPASAPTPEWQKPMVPLPVDVNALAAEAKKMPPPAVDTTLEPLPAPPVASKTPAAKSGDADRMAPPALPTGPHLAMPLAGIDPNKLPDTFEEKRDGRSHEALDIMSPRGTPVLAVAEGNVAKLFQSKDGGTTVYQFDNTRTWCYYYAHLDHYAAGLVEGTLLRKGQVLGYVGSTGNASGASPHLHLAVFRLNADKKWWQGTPIDPLPLLR